MLVTAVQLELPLQFKVFFNDTQIVTMNNPVTYTISLTAVDQGYPIASKL